MSCGEDVERLKRSAIVVIMVKRPKGKMWVRLPPIAQINLVLTP